MVGGIILCLCKTNLRHIGACLSTVGVVMWIFEKNPVCIILPKQQIICCVQNEKFYTTAKSKGRNLVCSIQRNLGFSERVERFQVDWSSIPQEFKKHTQGCFIWADGTVKTLATSIHPYAPIKYSAVKD